MMKLANGLILLALATGCVSPTRPVDTQLATYSGVLRLTQPSGIDMARLDLPGGDCLGVSLPEPAMARLRGSDGVPATIKGRVFEIPGDIEVATLRVKGREVEFRQCNNRFVFVEGASDLELR